MCVGLGNGLPVNMSVSLHGAECGTDLAFVTMFPTKWNLICDGNVLDSSKRSYSSQHPHVNYLRGSVLWIESMVTNMCVNVFIFKSLCLHLWYVSHYGHLLFSDSVNTFAYVLVLEPVIFVSGVCIFLVTGSGLCPRAGCGGWEPCLCVCVCVAHCCYVCQLLIPAWSHQPPAINQMLRL